MIRTAALAAAAMIGFAANSLLCRAALRGGAIDAASFTAIRLTTGACVLVAIVLARGTPRSVRAGNWPSAIALAAYAVAFSYAYLELEAGSGALLLFGSVQLTMIAGGLVRGERPTALQWIGWVIAIAGLVVINAPGILSASQRLEPVILPPPVGGALLMIAAGVAWGLYSLRGRGVTDPLATTAGNFARTIPIAAILVVVAVAVGARTSPRGIALAIASGGLASGLGYSLWYAAVPSLGATRAAAVQLSVPVIAAAGAIAMLGESLHPTLAGGGAAIICGLALALRAHR